MSRRQAFAYKKFSSHVENLGTTETAEKIGVNKSYVSRIDNKLQRPSVRIALKIQKLFKIPALDWFA